MLPRPITFLLVLLLLLGGGSSFADGKQRWGFEIKNFKLPQDGAMGDMAGLRSGYYLGGSRFSVGYEAHVGATQITGLGTADHIYYGGLTIGGDGLILKGLAYEVNLLVGYGDARFDTLGARTMGAVIEPSVGLGFVLGDGWRIGVRAGYLSMPGNSQFSGFNFGLRLDQKIQTMSKGYDE